MVKGSIYVLPSGGLGNILFKVMAGYAIAKKNNMRLLFVCNYRDQRMLMHKYKMFSKLNYIDFDKTVSKDCITINEQSFKYSDICIPDSSKNYILNGCFQSYKYSIGCEIRNIIFDCQSYALKTNPATAGKVKRIALHVRRGDYLQLRWKYPKLTDEYYGKALEIIERRVSKDYIIFAFSDDVEYLLNWKFLKDKNHKIVNLTNPEDSFMLMSTCDHFIISNSTFSLLAYYFRNPDKNSILTIPKNWFTPKSNDKYIPSGRLIVPEYDLEDLVEITGNVYIL